MCPDMDGGHQHTLLFCCLPLSLSPSLSQVRWTAAAADLAAQYTRLVGDMLLASGVIAYLGAFPGDLRQATLQGWTKVRGDSPHG